MHELALDSKIWGYLSKFSQLVISIYYLVLYQNINSIIEKYEKRESVREVFEFKLCATFQRKNETLSLSLSPAVSSSSKTLSLKRHSLFFSLLEPGALRSSPRIPHIGVSDSLISLSIH